MSRQLRQFCLRDSVPAAVKVPPDSAPSKHDEEDAAGSSMTWQQMQNFGTEAKKHESKSKTVRWTPVDLEAVEDLPVTSIVGDGRSWSEQQVDFAIVNKRQQRQPRDKVKDANSNISNDPNPAQPTATANTPKNAHAPSKRSRKLHSKNKKKEAKDDDMDTLPQSAYVPPHLRKRTIAPAVANETGAGVVAGIANAASTASLKSGTAHTDKAQSTPNRASHDSRQTPSPPTTRELPARPFKQKDSPSPADANGDETYIMPEGLAWDMPKPNPPPAAPRKENPRWPRTRGPRKHVWPKASEMRARSSESSFDGGVECRSDSNGDSEYDVKKLVDWNGDWMPAPESWQGRKGHVVRHLGKSVEQWIDTHPDIIRQSILEYEKSATFLDCEEIVPKFWILNKIEQGTLGEFWASMPTREPRALSNTSERPPFWERYKENDDDVIAALIVPDAQVDPADLDNHHPNLRANADEAVKADRNLKQRHARRSQRKQNRPVPVAVPTGPPVSDRRIVPKANVYFRPFQPRDVEGITAIYNHYVEDTIYAPEFEARTAAQISNRINTVIEEGLPYLVAITKGNHSRGQANYVQEKVVGFASLDDHCDRSSMYRYTFELEIFVHPGYTSQNIASCLLDALLEMCNTGYNACGGYEYRNDSEYLKLGPKRVIKVINLSVCKEAGENVDSTAKFLKRFDFSRAGRLLQVGYKFGKVIDMHIFQHTTSETIDLNGRPTVPL